MTHEQVAQYESGLFEVGQFDEREGRDEVSERFDSAARDYAQFVNPHVSDLLERLHLDKCFVSGAGRLLVDAEGTQYLDASSGYGAIPFGHNPDWVWRAVRDFEEGREPCIAQASLLPGAGELAEALLRAGPPGLRFASFANSGGEAVEAAIQACRLATGKREIIVTENYGKSLDEASGVSDRAFLRGGSGIPVGGGSSVPYGNSEALERALHECAAKTAAFLVEPIQGEGGVIEPPPGYLKVARGLCDRYGVLLIVDEIQTGLGRTGTLFACLSEGICPDALTLENGLGGGVLPISACLLSQRAYSKEFAFTHSSTFAGNALAMRVGLRVIDRLTSEGDGLLEDVVNQGNYLKFGLRDVQRKYGSAFCDVRGRGLMLGVQLDVDSSWCRRGTAPLTAAEDLPLLAASYLLNVARVRVAHPPKGSNVLRVQPALTVTREECDWIIRAFEELGWAMASGQPDRLVTHLTCPRETVRRALINQ
jgi:acetylornithine/succinyldiaminopimelate/putrescine aminotransferase